MMLRNRRVVRAGSLVLAAALGLVGCGGDGGSPVDSMQHVSLLPTYAQVEEATGAWVAEPGEYDVGKRAIMRPGRPFPICSRFSVRTTQAMVLGPAFPLPDGVGPEDAPGNVGAAARYIVQNHESGERLLGYLFIAVAKGDQFISPPVGSSFDSNVHSFVEVVTGYPQADPLAFDWASASLGEAQAMAAEMFDPDQPEYYDGLCSSRWIVSELIDDLPAGVVGYRDRQIDIDEATLTVKPETPFIDAPMLRFGQTLFATARGEWSVVVSLYSGDFDGYTDVDTSWKAEVVFAVDLVPVLEETVRLVEEHGPEVLKAKRAPSQAEAIKYLEAGWNEGTP